MTLVVCPFASLPDAVRRFRPDTVVTMASPRRLPPAFAAPRRLHLAFNDVAGPADGLVLPDAADVAALLRAAEEAGPGPLVVACEFGVSRSTAAAFALACRLEPGYPEEAIAAALRRACPVATPNPLVVALADAALARGGRMMAAVAVLGRGADYAPYPFAVLPAAGSATTPLPAGLVGAALP